MFKCQTTIEYYYKLYLCTTVKVYSVFILSEDTLHGISEKGKSIFFNWSLQYWTVWIWQWFPVNSIVKAYFLTVRLKNRFIILVLTVAYKISINTISLKIILRVWN